MIASQGKALGGIAKSRKFIDNVVEIVETTKKIGVDDPRRVLHSVKMGLALTLVSLLYYLRPLYDCFGQAGMWAVLTVVFVFEFTAGGTLSKGVNRGIATLLAGALGVGAECFASLCGDKGKPIILGLLVFILAAASTFIRFFPKVKKRCDYGVLIFILTFSLVAVSGVRVAKILQLAHQRLSTIVIGGVTCIVVSICVCPVWAGQDLHSLVAGNIEKLAAFLQGFADELDSSKVEGSMVSTKDGKPNLHLQCHKSVLNSKAREESLANFAWWEPGHGHFNINHPWEQYLNIGGLVRECACKVEALSGCINIRAQVASEFQPALIKTSTEASEVLKELASSMKNMTSPSPAEMPSGKVAASNLKSTLENSLLPQETNLQEVMSLLVIASLLLDIVKNIEEISAAVYELSRKAGFKKPNSTEKQQQLNRRGIVKPVDDHAVIEIAGTFESAGNSNQLQNEVGKPIADNNGRVGSLQENKNPCSSQRALKM